MATTKKKLYDFTGDPADEAESEKAARTSATGTHVIVDGWEAYQRWLRDLKRDQRPPGAYRAGD